MTKEDFKRFIDHFDEIHQQDIIDLCKLAELGLWARETGIPALRSFQKMDCIYHNKPHDEGCAGCVADLALSALPGETPRGRP